MHHHSRALYRLLLFVVCLTLLMSSVPTEAYAEEAISTDKIRDIYVPETKIVNPPTVVQQIDSVEKLSNLSAQIRPQGAWFTLTSDCQVQLSDKTIPLQEALTACSGKVIPILEIPNMNCANLISTAIKDHYFDLFFASADPAILKKLMDDQITHTRLVLITDEQDPVKVVETALPSGAMIVAQKKSTRTFCEYLQQRFMSIMVTPDEDDDELNVRHAVDCGANFVVMDDFQKAYDMYSAVPEVAYVRRSYIVGHRGMVSSAPDNTVEGLHEAFLAGADAVEIDIWRTKDDRIVCFHNNNLMGSTTIPPLEPEKLIIDYTYEELQKYTLLPKGDYSFCKIPTLEQMLEALSEYPGKILVIEIKDYQELAPLVHELLEQYDAFDDCVFISFGSNYLGAQQAVNPTLGASRLDGGYPVDSPLGCVERYYSLTAGIAASYSPSYNISADAIRQLHYRGVGVNLWTANTLTLMSEMATKGTQFITTDLVEDGATIREYYNNMGSEQIFGPYVSPDQKNAGLAIISILPWFFVLPALAFIAAIIAKIYNTRKK